MRKTILAAIMFALAASGVSQTVQRIPPFQVTYGNFTVGFQLGGSFGTAGQCPISTGSGTVWGVCGSGGGGGNPGGSITNVQVNGGGFFAGYASLTYSLANGLVVGSLPSGNIVHVGPQSTVPASWTFDWTTPALALNSLSGAPLNGVGTSGTWPINVTGNAGTASSAPYSGLTGTVPTWNQNTTGNAATATLAATATALAAPPTTCPAGSAPTGVTVSGNPVGCTYYATSTAHNSRKNCLSVACAGGSTYAAGITYTNSSPYPETEEVVMNANSPGCGTTAQIFGYVAGSVNMASSAPNACVASTYAGITYTVLPGETFEVVLTTTNGTPTISSWYAVQ